MLDQSMKYHNLASLEELIAFKEGRLSSADAQRIATQIENNPMVAAVAEGCTSISSTSVSTIAKKTQSTIAKQYLSKIGFWTKYGAWIGLSSIILIVGLFFLFKNSQVDEQYTKEQLVAKVTTISDAMGNKLQQSKNNTLNIVPIPTGEESNDEPTFYDVEKGENKNVFTDEKEKNIKKLNVKLTNKQTDINSINPLETSTEYTRISSASTVPKATTRDFSNEVYHESSNTVVLAVQNVQILAKLNPKLTKKSKGGRSGSPFQSFSNKETTGTSYSIEDVPKFRGGDRGLKNYFKGALSPIKIPENENRYDRNVLIVLDINSRGKLKDYKIRGKLYPKHQKALEEAIKNIPRFSKGAVDIVYKLGISF